MRVRLCVTLLLLVVMALPAPGFTASWAGAEDPYPHLAGTLPAVETHLLQTLRAAGLSGPLVHIGADTNGHLTVASLVFTYDDRAPDPLPALRAYAWDAIRSVFAAGLPLDELDLSGLGQRSGPFDPSRSDVTFSAAISPEEFRSVPEQLSAQDALALLPRVWYARRLLGRTDRPSDAGGERTAGAPHRRSAWRVVYRGSPSSPSVALTFDDGPFPIYTTLLLDTLSRLRLQATFFLVGERVEQYPYFARAIARAGHEIGNHTYHHVNLTRLSAAEMADELERTQTTISRITGVTPRYFRPPGGDYNATVLHTAGALGLTTVFWTDDPADYADLGPRVLEARLLGRVSHGGILLLHQGVGDTIHILAAAEGVLRRKGYAVTTVSGLVAGRPLL